MVARKLRYSAGGDVNTSRRVSFGGSFDAGDQIRFVTDPLLGSGAEFILNMTLRLLSRLQSAITMDTSRFLDPGTDTEEFDVKIFRAVTTYQFTDRFLIRNITEKNTFNRTLSTNVLFTYRVNAGSVFYVGYDDHYRQGNQVVALVLHTHAWLRTNRAIFAKLQYLFRL